MLQKGMHVMLTGLQIRADLNYKVFELGAYVHDSQRWVVNLPCGRKVKVREANIQTMDVCAQNFYHMFGYPDQNTPALADLVEERTGEHGRYLVAKQTIFKGTLARDAKKSMQMTGDANKQLGKRFDAFVLQAVSAILHEEIPIPEKERGWNVTASYLGQCVREGWLQDALVQDLMRYDCYSEKVLQETMDRLHFEDLFWFDFWCNEMPDVPADTLWRLQSFLMSHAFLHDRTVSVGKSSLAACTPLRWTWYLAVRNGEDPEPLPETADVTGNFMEMPWWLAQAQKGRGDFLHVPANECVIFHDEVRAGQELLLDYSDTYFPDNSQQMRQDCPPGLRTVLSHIVSRLDPRVIEAFEAYMPQ